MKLVNELIKEARHIFSVPVEGRVEFAVSKDKQVKPGDILFKKEYKKILDTYNIGLEFNIPLKDIKEYITRVDGEFVTKGEVLAEIVSKGGLSVKKVLATYDGILSFERIDKGYLEILSEHITEEVGSSIIGKVVDVDYNLGIKVSSNAFVFKTFVKSEVTGEGIFEVLKEGESIYSTRDLSISYTGKIVYVGRFAYANLIEEIMARGAIAVVTWAIDYLDYEKVKKNVIVLGGFGQISYEEFIKKYITAMGNSYVSITNKCLYWSDIGQTLYKDSNNDLIRSGIRVNDKVRIIDVQNFGKIGKVVDIDTDGYFIVKLENQDRVLLSEESLEVIE